MKAIDYHFVPPHQSEAHERLVNWARWVRVGQMYAKSHPMWAKAQSNARQWHQPEPRITVRLLDAYAVEEIVRTLPALHRDALRWHYVRKSAPWTITRRMKVSGERLAELVIEARGMIGNVELQNTLQQTANV